MKPTPGQPNAHWTIDTLLEARPNAARILMRHGMACVGCVMARFETLAEAAREYRLDLACLLEELEGVQHRPRKDARGVSRAGGPKASKPVKHER